MKRIFIFPSVILLLLAACNDSSRNDTYDKVEVVTDTTVTKMEESVSTGNTKKSIPASDKFTNLHDETDIEKLLCQGWVMDDDVSVLRDNNDPEGMYPYRCFYFFDDNTYTRNVRNAMEYGTWSYNDSRKIFSVHPAGYGSQDDYKIAAIGPDDMIILNHSEGSSTRLTYLADGVKYKNKNDDPFYIANNRWRIRPLSSESDEEVRSRLKQCIWFHILFYRDNLERKQTLISFYGIPSCLKWYGGGIGVINESELPDNWFACFYNREQALKARKMMVTIINKKYKWSTGKVSWVKKNLEVLEQMYADL